MRHAKRCRADGTRTEFGVFENMTKTVIIAGAGASSEVYLPTGSELKSQIAVLLDIQFRNSQGQVSGDLEIVGALRAIMKESGEKSINPFLYHCRRIRDAMPQALPIDNFIDAHNDDPRVAQCGKLQARRCRRSTLADLPSRLQLRPSDRTLPDEFVA